MSDNIAYRDAYARSTDATVAAVIETDRGPGVILDRTVFYPGGGGQPADAGWLEAADATTSWTVAGAAKQGDDVVHQLAVGSETPAVGSAVRATIDWDRRHLLMRTHTALHALCGVVWRD
jgi:misacylated tRNA(Ala) deacylase